MTTHPALDLTTVRRIAELDKAAQSNSRIRFSLDGGDNVAEGVARAFTDENGNFFHDGDVRDAHLWVSGFVERFIPVSQILGLYDLGMFAVDA